MYGEEPSASVGRMGPVARPPCSGGGWAVWPMRVVLSWAAILIAGYRGVQAITVDETPSNANGTGNDTGTSGFPAALGEAFAMRFGEAYLNYSPGTAAQRAQEPAAFIPVSFGAITSLKVPQGGSTCDITVTMDWTLPGQAGTGAPRLATTYDVSVVDQQSGKWYVKDIRASTQPVGIQ